MELIDLAMRYKELGGLGLFLLAMVRWGDKLFVWILERLGIRINRQQSREDKMDEKLDALTLTVAQQDKRITKIEGAYEIVHDIVHKAADGIENEMKEKAITSIAIAFFVGQLRTIQALEEVLKD